MINVLKIDEFWREVFPMFQQSYEFIYAFLDITTIICLIRVTLKLPGALLFGSRKQL